MALYVLTKSQGHNEEVLSITRGAEDRIKPGFDEGSGTVLSGGYSGGT